MQSLAPSLILALQTILAPCNLGRRPRLFASANLRIMHAVPLVPMPPQRTCLTRFQTTTGSAPPGL